MHVGLTHNTLDSVLQYLTATDRRAVESPWTWIQMPLP